jgi:hypothetical protein
VPGSVPLQSPVRRSPTTRLQATDEGFHGSTGSFLAVASLRSACPACGLPARSTAVSPIWSLKLTKCRVVKVAKSSDREVGSTGTGGSQISATGSLKETSRPMATSKTRNCAAQGAQWPELTSECMSKSAVQRCLATPGWSGLTGLTSPLRREVDLERGSPGPGGAFPKRMEFTTV